MNKKLFENPPAEFRGAPFWAWNCRLEKDELLRQIEIYEQMGIGGFHIHARTGLNTRYLGDEFMECVRLSVDEAARRGMKAWLYDEDRWPSGFGGGLVTEKPEHRMKFILFTQVPYGSNLSSDCNIPCAMAARSENGFLLSKYAVVLKNGCLSEYRRLPSAGEQNPVPEEGQIWYAYLETAAPSEWFNGQTYVDTLSKEAIECFVNCTHERYKEVVGDQFGSTVAGIFTDEPQFTGKQCFSSAEDSTDLIIPFTTEFTGKYTRQYGDDFLDFLPELFWELSEGKPSVHRYRYHDFSAGLFAKNYAGTLGAWCRKNNIKLTGHLMNEPSLGSQTGPVGEAMRSYIDFDIPGIDIINDYFEYTSAKQAQSVARQKGAPGIMSELYGVTSWDYDFKGHKAQGDWQAAMGVILRVHHLTWVSMKGESKRDYPASIGYQSPWYERYSVVEDHFARVNLAMTSGKPVVKVGVIHPIESYWLAYGPADQTGAERAHRERQFDEINRMLLFGLIDYDLICESLLPEQCALDHVGKTFPVGLMRYQVIILPGMRTIRGTTLERLEKFVSCGGTLIIAGETPSLVDAELSDAPARLAKRAVQAEFSAHSILSCLDNVRDICVLNADGTPAQDLFYQLRDDDDERFLFVCNTNRVESREHLCLKIRGEWTCSEMDTLSGEFKDIVCRYDPAFTEIDCTLHPAGSLLLSLRAGREESVPAEHPICRKESGRLPEAFDYSLSEPNVLLLDQARWSWNGEPLRDKEETLRIDRQLRNRLGVKQRDGLGRQPWADEDPAPVLGTLTLEFEFESQQEISGCELAAECPEDLTVVLNGTPVPADRSDGWWVDKCLIRIPLPTVFAGKNVLRIDMPFCRKTDLEWFYLLGGFGVDVRGDTSRLIPLPERLPYGDWTRYGFPFYAGNIDYRVELPAAGICSVQVPQFKGALLDFFVEEQLVGTAAFPPYEVTLIDNMKKGDRLTIRVYGNRVNAFGTVHNTDTVRNDWVRYGPLGYRSEGRDWSYEYQLRPMGILCAPLFSVNYKC